MLGFGAWGPWRQKCFRVDVKGGRDMVRLQGADPGRVGARGGIGGGEAVGTIGIDLDDRNMLPPPLLGRQMIASAQPSVRSSVTQQETEIGVGRPHQFRSLSWV